MLTYGMKMSRKIPLKLNAEPIIEAIIEIRLEASESLSDMLPGVLLAKLGGKAVKTEKLPPASIPKQIRDTDPNLSFQPLIKITLDDYRLLVGDQLVALICPVQPYPGGAEVKQKAVELFGEVLALDIVEKVHRFSMKYTDFIAADTLAEAVSHLTVNVTLGNNGLENCNGINFQFALGQDSSLINIVRVVAVADVARKNSTTSERGIVIEVDSINKLDTQDIDAFKNNFPQLLDSLHSAHKEVFFSLLTEDTLAKLEAVYE